MSWSFLAGSLRLVMCSLSALIASANVLPFAVHSFMFFTCRIIGTSSSFNASRFVSPQKALQSSVSFFGGSSNSLRAGATPGNPFTASDSARLAAIFMIVLTRSSCSGFAIWYMVLPNFNSDGRVFIASSSYPQSCGSSTHRYLYFTSSVLAAPIPVALSPPLESKTGTSMITAIFSPSSVKFNIRRPPK